MGVELDNYPKLHCYFYWSRLTRFILCIFVYLLTEVIVISAIDYGIYLSEPMQWVFLIAFKSLEENKRGGVAFVYFYYDGITFRIIRVVQIVKQTLPSFVPHRHQQS